MNILMAGHPDRVAKPSELLALYLKYEGEMFDILYNETGFPHQCEIFFKFYGKKYNLVHKENIKISKYDVVVCCSDGRNKGLLLNIILEAILRNIKIINLLCSGIKLSKESKKWVPFTNPANEIKYGRKILKITEERVNEDGQQRIQD